MDYKSKEIRLRTIILIGLLLRLVFIMLSPDQLPGSRNFYTTNDSFSFSNAFINWWVNDIYSFDLNHPDARFGRLPGYPIYWGVHYLIFGAKYVYQSVAFTQAILDTIIIFLLYKISLRLNPNKNYALVVAIIYALNPFAIYWVPITGTETLGVFITLLFFYFLFTKSYLKYYPVYIGLIAAAAFFVRPYLAILMVSAVLFLFLKKPEFWFRKILIMSLAFWMIYAVWPIRNYIVSNDLILVKTSNSGYHRYGSDITSCRNYLFTWTTEFDYYMDSVFVQGEDFRLPPEAIPEGFTSNQIKATIQKALTCGSGFAFWKEGKPIQSENCNEEVSAEFNSYTKALYATKPFESRTSVPLQNLSKMYFKQQTIDSNRPVLENILFFFRSVILIAATLGAILGWFKLSPEGFALSLFFIAIYILIGYILRQVEMRYLLQADAVILPCLVFAINWVRTRSNNQKAKSNFVSNQSEI